jgi:hypothetical protein
MPAKCLVGDKVLGSVQVVADFFNMFRVPKHGFFCVNGQGVFVGGNVLFADNTAPFDVELVQKASNGSEVVINSTTIDPQTTPSFNIIFAANSEEVNRTRCFVRLLGNGNDEIIIQSLDVHAIQ